MNFRIFVTYCDHAGFIVETPPKVYGTLKKSVVHYERQNEKSLKVCGKHTKMSVMYCKHAGFIRLETAPKVYGNLKLSVMYCKHAGFIRRETYPVGYGKLTLMYCKHAGFIRR